MHDMRSKACETTGRVPGRGGTTEASWRTNSKRTLMGAEGGGAGHLRRVGQSEEGQHTDLKWMAGGAGALLAESKKTRAGRCE